MTELSPYVMPGVKRIDMPDTLITVNENDCLAAVSHYFDISIVELKKKNRHRKIVYPRQIAAYFIRQYTQNSLKDICNIFDGAISDHASVIYYVNLIKGLKDVTPKVSEDIENIKHILLEMSRLRIISFKHK